LSLSLVLSAMGLLQDMTSDGLSLEPITVCGRINSAAFQKAKAVAETVALPSLTLKPLLPTEYDLYIEKLRSEMGGLAWAHASGAAAFTATDFVGDEVALIAWLRSKGVAAAVPAISKSWEEVAEDAYFAFLQSSGLTYTFLEFTMDGQSFGNLIFELYSDRVPKTAANFEALCTGEKGVSDGVKLHYLGSKIHRIFQDGWLQGGDIVDGTGAGGASSIGEPLPDENFCVAHDTPGVLGMASTGHHTALSQFYITLRPMPTFDRKYVAFGRLIDGLQLLRFLGSLKTKNDKPMGELVISNCGTVSAAILGGYNTEAAAIKLQALQRTKLAKQRVRKEKKEKEKKEEGNAATKVQASRRGQMARRKNKQ